MLQGDDNDGPENLCERGFKYVESLYDRRLLLQNYIEEVIKYDLEKKDKSVEKEVLISLRKILLHIANSTNRVKRKIFQFNFKHFQKKSSAIIRKK